MRHNLTFVNNYRLVHECQECLCLVADPKSVWGIRVKIKTELFKLMCAQNHVTIIVLPKLAYIRNGRV